MTTKRTPIGTFTPDDGLKPGAGSIGVAVANTEWKLLALDDDGTSNDSDSVGSAELAAPGARGELCIRRCVSCVYSFVSYTHVCVLGGVSLSLSLFCHRFPLFLM